MQKNRFLRLTQVLHRTGLSKSIIYELIRDEKFPKQIRLTERTIAWVEAEIDHWIDARIAERDTEADQDA